MLQPSDEIKSKLDIVDVIKDYVPLKPAGVNFRGKCPFHNEKTPSFIVSPDKQIWHCFGCSKGGDIFSFIMEIEGIDFVEALRILAPKAGVTLKKQNPKLTSQRNRVLDILDLSRRIYAKFFWESKEAKGVREYLKKRGLSEETIEEWQIGYSPSNWDTVFNLLRKKRFSENEIFLSGMCVKSTNRPGFYDRFRGRIMFPINDINGNTVAFSARVDPEKEEEEKMGKYINSPQTLVYDKSKVLFGIDKAKLEIKKSDKAVIVEGQMDAITAHQNEYKNVIASSGTALTSDQVSIMKRYTTNLVLAFDMDDAGAIAAERGIREAWNQEMNVRVLTLLEGQDPDDCIKNDPSQWEKAVSEAKPVMQFYFDRTFKDLDLAKIEDRRQAVKVLLPVIVRIGNKIEQDYWLRSLSQTIDTPENILRETLIQLKDQQAKRRKTTTKTAQIDKEPKESNKRSIDEQLSELLITLLLKFPDLIGYTANHVQIDQIKGLYNQKLYKDIIFYYNNINNWTGEQGQEKAIDFHGMRGWLEEKLIEENSDHNNQLRFFDKLVILGDEEFGDLTFEKAKEEVIRIISQLKRHYLIGRMKEVEKAISFSEKENDQKHARELTEELKILSEELHDISNI
jgi:DNA primase